MTRVALVLLSVLVALGCADAPAPVPVPVPAPRCLPYAACPALPPPAPRDTSSAWRAIAPRLAAPDADDLLEIELQVARVIDPSLDLEVVRREVESMAAAVRRNLPRRCDTRCRVEGLNRYLFDTVGFVPERDPDRLYDDVRNDLLPSVLRRRRGYCVGLSHLYLTLALRIGLDATLVPVRQHEFVRVVDARGLVVDVDPTRRGGPPMPAAVCASASAHFGRALTRRQVAGRTLALLGLAPGFAGTRWLDAAVDLDPTDPNLFNNRSTLRLRDGDAAGALDDLQRAAALDPCTPLYAVNTANVLGTMGRSAEAHGQLDAVTAVGGPSMIVEVRRALMRYDEGHDAEAEAAFLAALARWSGAPAILQARAAVRLAQGRASDALRDTQAALSLEDTAESHGSVVLAALEAGEVATATEALAGLEARSPVAASVDLHRALVAVAQGRYGVAEAAARRCLTHYGRACVRALLVLADVAEARGEGVCARRYATAYLSCPRAANDRRQQRFDAATRTRYLRESTAVQSDATVQRPRQGLGR